MKGFVCIHSGASSEVYLSYTPIKLIEINES